MNKKSRAEKVISTLEEKRFFAECPCCGDTILLSRADLFYLDDFTPNARKLYRSALADLAHRRKEIRDARKAIPKSSKVTTQAVNIGYIIERVAPVLSEFRFEHGDCRALFDPIDYVVFEGLRSEGKVTRLFFVDIKTGSAPLTPKQREIKALVEAKRVDWDVYETKDGSSA